MLVTCLHVIERGESIVAKMEDGTALPVTIIRIRKERDLALLEAKGENFPTLKIGENRLARVGERVFVVGNPLGLGGTVTDGLVSALRLSSGKEPPLLQITAPISPGSSGSPVFNEKGEVIGVARMQATSGQALNFATPLKASDGHQFKLHNVAEWERWSMLEEWDELADDEELAAWRTADLSDLDITDEQWRQVEARFPRNSALLLRRAEALSQWSGERVPTEKLEQAEKLYRKAVALNSTNTLAWSSLATILWHLNRRDEVVDVRRELAKLEPRKISRWIDLGRALEDAGKLEEAILSYRRATAIDDEDPFLTEERGKQQLWMCLAVALLKAGRHEDALTSAERATRLRFFTYGSLGWGGLLTMEGADKALNIVNIAVGSAVRGEVDRAITQLSNALTARPENDDATASYDLGVLHLQRGAFENASVAFENAAAFAEKEELQHTEVVDLRHLALAGLAVVRRKAGDAAEARRALEHFAAEYSKHH